MIVTVYKTLFSVVRELALCSRKGRIYEEGLQTKIIFVSSVVKFFRKEVYAMCIGFFALRPKSIDIKVYIDKIA